MVEGDLSDPASLPRLVEGADVVYHSAAKVGDWGRKREFREQIIEATGNLLTASRAAGVGRFLYVSSIIVYGHPKERAELFTEDEPLGQNLWWWGDFYCQAKIKAEELVRTSGVPWSIVRPSWTYGPRDRTSLPRVFKALAARRAAIVGTGDNKLNIIYAGDVADGAIRAATSSAGLSQAYNLASAGEITQREFIDFLTAELGVPPVRRRVPFWLAFYGGFLAEIIGRLIFLQRPPHFTRYVINLIGRSTRFSTEKARTQLGWQPLVPVQEGVRRTLDWYYETIGGKPNLLAGAAP
jgi:nucleoside-diphosphate-sugar epimerase